MGVPCMPVRTLCLVIGREFHGALGVPVPPVPPVAPSKLTLYISAITSYYGVGDAPVANVIVCGEPAIQKGSDSKYFRPHVTVVSVVPPNIAFPGVIVDLGFIAFVFIFGASKTIWGPTSVKVSGKAIAVIGIPFVPFNPFNQLVCSDPCDLPLGSGVQMPSNVFAGMGIGDYLLCVVSMAIDMLVSFLLNCLFGGLDFLGTFLGKNLLTQIEKRLGPKLLGLLGKGLGKLWAPVVKAVEKRFGEHAAEIIGKVFEEPLKKAASAGAGIPITPDEWLGFGKDNRS